MTIYHMLSLRQILWRVLLLLYNNYIHDQTSRNQSGWSCGGSCVGWLTQWWICAFSSLKHAFWLQVIDFYVCWTNRLFESQLLHTSPNSSVSCVSASCPQGQGSILDSAQKYFPWENARNNILMYGAWSVWSLWFDINGWFIMYSYILCVCSFISHMGL